MNKKLFINLCILVFVFGAIMGISAVSFYALLESEVYNLLFGGVFSFVGLISSNLFLKTNKDLYFWICIICLLVTIAFTFIGMHNLSGSKLDISI